MRMLRFDDPVVNSDGTIGYLGGGSSGGGVKVCGGTANMTTNVSILQPFSYTITGGTLTDVYDPATNLFNLKAGKTYIFDCTCATTFDGQWGIYTETGDPISRSYVYSINSKYIPSPIELCYTPTNDIKVKIAMNRDNVAIFNDFTHFTLMEV